MRAEIIAVGTELLLGQIVNSNAQYLSEQLSELGMDVYYHTVVGDNELRITEALQSALSRSEVIITTGGLGPTIDDLTKETVAKVLNLPLRADQHSLEEIQNFFNRIGRPMLDNNRKQAYFPEGSTILPNAVGTAPGAVVKSHGRYIIILPGPPFELKRMFTNEVIPYLTAEGLCGGEVLVSRTLRIYGKGESAVEAAVRDILESQSNPTVAPLAQLDEINLRITAKAPDNQQASKMIDALDAQLTSRLGSCVFGRDKESLEVVTGRLLKERGLSLAAAESCTGGLISSRVTDVPGSSEYFAGGLVTYSNRSKMQLLGVSSLTLDKHGAVSPETAREMAVGVRKKLGTNIGLAVTGIAGPGGGSAEKPVGLVYGALADEATEIIKQFQFHGPRENIKRLTANAALNLVRLYLLAPESRYTTERGDN